MLKTSQNLREGCCLALTAVFWGGGWPCGRKATRTMHERNANESWSIQQKRMAGLQTNRCVLVLSVVCVVGSAGTTPGHQHRITIMQMRFGYNFGKLSIAVVPEGTEPTKDDWKELDPNTLPEGERNAYQAYKSHYKAMKEAKVTFENRLRNRCGLVAVVKAQPKASSKALSLDAFIRINELNGHAV